MIPGGSTFNAAPFGGPAGSIVPAGGVPMGSRLAARYYFFLGGAAGAVDVAPDLPRAIRARLLAAESLADLVAVYKGDVPQGAAYPFLVFNPLFTGDPELNTSDTFMEVDTYQFSVFAASNPDDESINDGEWQADRLADAARLVLSPRSGNAKLEFADGKMVVHVPGGRRRSRKQDARGPRDTDVWMSSFDVNFLVQRDL